MDEYSLHNDLQQRWKALSDRQGIFLKKADGHFATIIQHYTESNRHYHNLQHLHAMFRHLQAHEQALENAKAVYLAVFYHDIIYNALRKDNELKSAAFAQKALTDLGWNKPTIELVYALILATQQHRATQATNDFYYLLDADLAILGSDSKTYQWYAQAIRKEYHWVPSVLYKSGRRKVLQHFLERETLYFTLPFQQQFEEQARRNLVEELKYL